MIPASRDRRGLAASTCLVLLAAGLWSASRAISSGDLWVALGCGRYILSHGVSRTDPFAFTSLPGTWVDQNWLSHVLLTLIHAAAGLAGLAVWKAAVCVAIAALTAQTAWALGATRPMSLLAAVGVAVAGRSFFDVRPNLHTILLTAILLRWMVGLEGRPWRAFWVPLAGIALWANLHGGFLFGILALAAGAGALALLRLARRLPVASWPVLLALPVAALAVSLISPYLVSNLTHPWQVSAGPAAKYWRTVAEWRPPYGPGALGDAGVRAFWALALACVLAGALLGLAFWRARGRIVPRREGSPETLPIGAVALVALLLSATSRRFVPLFAVTSLPYLAAALSRLRAPFPVPARAYAIAAAAAVLLAGADIADRLFLPNALWPGAVPWSARLVRADEQPIEATRYLLGSGARGRLLTDWTWGGYLLYSDPFDNGQPRYQIYIDGRAQAAYPAEVSEDYEALLGAAYRNNLGAVKAFLDHFQIDVCLLDRRDPGLAAMVPDLTGWMAVYADDKSVIAVRAQMADGLAIGPFPDEATREASAAIKIRTGVDIRHHEARRAFDHARDSVRARPTTTGIAEMTRISILAGDPIGMRLRGEARVVLDSLLAARIPGTTIEALTIRSNAEQCRATLAGIGRDESMSDKMRLEAQRNTARLSRLTARYLR